MTRAFTAASAPEAAAVPTFSGGACPVLPSPGTGTGIPRDARNGEKGKKNEQRRMKRWRMHSVGTSAPGPGKTSPGRFWFSLSCRAQVAQLFLGTRAGFHPRIPEHLRADPSAAPSPRSVHQAPIPPQNQRNPGIFFPGNLSPAPVRRERDVSVPAFGSARPKENLTVLSLKKEFTPSLFRASVNFPGGGRARTNPILFPATQPLFPP